MLGFTYDNDELSRKDRERLFKRNEILSAAVKLFADKGYDNTTLDVIAESAEFGKGTLYNYFQNKKEIYAAIIELIFDDYLKIHKKILNETNTIREFFTEITRSLLLFCTEKQDWFRLMVRFRIKMMDDVDCCSGTKVKEFQAEILKLFSARVAEAVQKNEIKETDPVSLLLLYKSMLFPYIHYKTLYFQKSEIDVEKELEFILSILFEGILVK